MCLLIVSVMDAPRGLCPKTVVVPEQRHIKCASCALGVLQSHLPDYNHSDRTLSVLYSGAMFWFSCFILQRIAQVQFFTCTLAAKNYYLLVS